MFSRFYVLRLVFKNTRTPYVSRKISKDSKCFNQSSLSIIEQKDEKNDCIEKFETKNEPFDHTGYVSKLLDKVYTKEISNTLVPPENDKFLQKDDGIHDDALEDIDERLPQPLDTCTEDLSYIGPNVPATFNLAKFADQSNTIQQLVKLGVELYKVEKDRTAAELFLKLQFEDMKPYIQFLHDCGVPPENLGNFITRNPRIFMESLDNLHTRIRYLRHHNFTSAMIKDIVVANPYWLSFETKEIDKRLSYFQNTFYLNGNEVRMLTTKCPRLITYDTYKIRYSTFSVQQEMGFEKHEIKHILLRSPRVWIRARSCVLETFNYLHNSMQLSHTMITKQSNVLLCRKRRLESRDKFLAMLKRNQYDPQKPMYVAPMTLATGSDITFCKDVAKTSVSIYNAFLRTM